MPVPQRCGGNFFIINLLYGSEWRHGAATCHNSGELPTRQPRQWGSQPVACSQLPVGWNGRERTRYKIQNCSSLGGQVAQVKAHPGAGRQLGNWAELGPSPGQTRVLPISLLTIVIATLPTFSHPTQQRRQRQFVCTLLHELSAQWGKQRLHLGLMQVLHCVQLLVRQVRWVWLHLNHCAAAETRAEAGRECLARVACLGRVTGSYLCCIYRGSLHPSLTTIASAILSALFKR